MESEVKAATVKFHGKVQGVYFRDHALREAKRLGLVGWVRNERDGSVAAYFEGPEVEIKRAIDYCRRSIPMAEVKLHQVEWMKPLGDLTEFEVRY